MGDIAPERLAHEEIRPGDLGRVEEPMQVGDDVVYRSAPLGGGIALPRPQTVVRAGQRSLRQRIHKAGEL